MFANICFINPKFSKPFSMLAIIIHAGHCNFVNNFSKRDPLKIGSFSSCSLRAATFLNRMPGTNNFLIVTWLRYVVQQVIRLV